MSVQLIGVYAFFGFVYLIPAIVLYRSASNLESLARLAYAIIAPLIFIAGVWMSFKYLSLSSEPPSENQALMIFALGAMVGVIAITGLYQGLNWLCRKEGASRPSFNLEVLRQSMADWFWSLLLVGALLAAVAFSLLVERFLGVPAVIVALIVAGSLFALLYLVFKSEDRKRMNYTVEGNAALEKIADGLREELLGNDPSMVKIQGEWWLGYPKISILFGSDEAIRRAEASGLLDRISDNVGKAIRNDPAFGRNRESFDSKQAVYAQSAAGHSRAI